MPKKQPPPVEKPSIEPRKKQQCCCNWGDTCLQIQEALSQLQQDDLWKGNMVSISNVDVPQVQALRSCVVHHFQIADGVKKRLYVARHHWSRTLLTYLGPSSRRTTPIDISMAKRFDSLENHSRHQDRCNNIQQCLQRIKKPCPDASLAAQFVQAPIVDKRSAIEFVDSLKSSRSSRLHRRLDMNQTPGATKTAGPPRCSTAKPPAKFDSSLSVGSTPGETPTAGITPATSSPHPPVKRVHSPNVLANEDNLNSLLIDRMRTLNYDLGP